MENNENNSFKNGTALKESNGTGIVSTMIFMIVTVIVMIILKHFIG